MGQLEAVAQQQLQLAPNRVAVGSGRDEDVRRESREAGGDRPEMEVVDADDALRPRDRRADLARVRPRGRALEQHAHGLAEDAGRAQDDEQADQDRRDRVGVGPAGRKHDEPRDDNAGGGGEVGEHVQHGRADVQTGAGAVEHARSGEVDEEAGDARCEHPASRDAGRIGEPPGRLPDDPGAEDDEDERVRECGQHLGAPPAEAPLRRCRPVREPRREEGEPERERVREHVRRVGEQRERPGHEPGEHLDSGEPEHERERRRQGPLLSAVSVHVGTVAPRSSTRRSRPAPRRRTTRLRALRSTRRGRS